MATCRRCQQSHFGVFDLKGGLCTSCREAEAEHRSNLEARRPDASRPVAPETVDAIMVTTETHVPDLQIAARVGIVTAECVLGLHLFKDFFVGMRDIVGGRSNTMQTALRDLRGTALFELKREAATIGADAVIAVSLDYSEISNGPGGQMLFLVASGTAVKLR
ncbi:MAG: YbjQ family protein [Marinibacterium sp.]